VISRDFSELVGWSYTILHSYQHLDKYNKNHKEQKVSICNLIFSLCSGFDTVMSKFLGVLNMECGCKAGWLMDKNFTTETLDYYSIYIEKYRAVLTFAIYDIYLHFLRNPDNCFGITEEKNTSSKSFSPYPPD